ncbi:Uncharacterized membrane protein YfcA [Desulfonispora thiosulfatigenes DSM 11270]|uniref:Probable membrane transporter protein n=1 Tax=Desulfonispora thiosulfatigenes DSM 11270 TaxID=656914 RepID=A0A1W1V3E5_DESTI|nr:sulfite exporter TauE/SafE family protein [Desulfonispora thiosulfatigenes]SMB87810.1 Uncharacterized membrane protein YfcA [Desulfonispora thiosulfatigenes DSM 11270]
MDSYILFFSIVLIASILQTSTGFGFSIMATPFLLLLFMPKEAIQVNLILSIFISVALITTIKNDIDFEILKRFIIGSSFGIPFGIIFFLFLDMNTLKLGVSIIILILTVLLIRNFRINQTDKRDFAVGAISGTLTAAIGMPGPPVLLYFSGTETEKEKLRATTLAFYIFVYSASLVIQIIFAKTSKTVWISSTYAIPVVIMGLYLGQLLFKKINQETFRIFTYFILLSTGSYLLFESWKW